MQLWANDLKIKLFGFLRKTITFSEVAQPQKDRQNMEQTKQDKHDSTAKDVGSEVTL